MILFLLVSMAGLPFGSSLEWVVAQAKAARCAGTVIFVHSLFRVSPNRS